MASNRPRNQQRQPVTPASKGSLVAILVAFLLVVAALWAAIWWLDLETNLGLDLQGGASITLVPAPGQEIDDAVLDQTVDVIRNRIDALGVAEPDIARQGDNVLVQLPGVADVEQAVEIVGRTAQLQFRPVLEVIPPGTEEYAEVSPSCAELEQIFLEEGPPDPDEETVVCERGFVDPEAPADAEEMPRDQWAKYRLGPMALGGEGIDDALSVPDETGVQWQVQLDLTSEGAEEFAAITGELACEPQGSDQRLLAIVLDGIVESAPTMNPDVQCNRGITGGTAQITTPGGQEDASELSLVLRTGALPITLDAEQFQSVSPTLGAASLQAGLLAGFIGLGLVAVYMILLYRGMGLAAVTELAMFGVLVYGAIIVLSEAIGFTLTLAGIAGIIVSIGIAADSSIIYRERYRDEIRAGRTVRTAAEHAFRKAWRTNLTGNTVSFLAALVLYILAVGPVRGFAFTLGLSTLIDTALFGTFTRSLFGLVARQPKLAKSSLVGLGSEVVAPDVAREKA